MSRQHQRSQQSGQILILMAMLSTTLVILFGMVVGVGHMIQAKINLQNAVDMAAMSGASWQARYLNHVALINYRMRQNYKFTLYDLYVTQSRFNKSISTQTAGGFSTFDRLSGTLPGFGICQQAKGYCGKSVIGEDPECFSLTTDMCQNVDTSISMIPSIEPSLVPNLSPILAATNVLIGQLAATARRYCLAASKQNGTYFTYIMQRLDKQERFQMGELVNVLKDFSTAFSNDTNATITPGSSGRADRTIAQTFFGNLIAANASGGPTLEYLNDPISRTYVDSDLPNLQTNIFNPTLSIDTSKYFQRQSVRTKVNVVEFRLVGTSGCDAEVVGKTYAGLSGNGTFLGLTRSRVDEFDPTSPVKIPFHVALRATVKPNLLFWPQGATPTLVAVAVAKPFGSRIGPSKVQTTYEVTGSTNDNNYALANMSFYPGDITQGGNDAYLPGMGHKSIVKYLKDRLPNNGINEQRPSIVYPGGQSCSPGAGPLPFLCLALAPTLYEGFFWNAFPYSKGSATAAEEAFVGTGLAIFNAFPSDVGLQVADDNAYNMPDRMITAGGAQSWHSTTYIGDDPSFKVNGKPSFFATPTSALSSWSPAVKMTSAGAPLTQSDIIQNGRMGYQIKLVSFREICDEITAGGVVQPQGLSRYCSGDGTVFH